MQRSAPRRPLGPIELEVIHGTIRAAELEIEAAVERTSRSPICEMPILRRPGRSMRSRLAQGAAGSLMTCMGLFLSSGCFGLC